MTQKFLSERMAKLEEKVDNIKENLDDVVKKKLPEIETKINDLTKYIYIALGVYGALQLAITLYGIFK